MRGRGSSKEVSRELPTIRLLLQEDRRLDARLFSRFSSRLRAGRESSISSSKMESRDSARSKWLSPIDSAVIVVPYDCCALLAGNVANSRALQAGTRVFLAFLYALS